MKGQNTTPRHQGSTQKKPSLCKLPQKWQPEMKSPLIPYSDLRYDDSSTLFLSDYRISLCSLANGHFDSDVVLSRKKYCFHS